MQAYYASALKRVAICIFVAVFAGCFGDLPNDGAVTSRDLRLTILQTTDLHHHANGAGHVGLDVDATTGMSATGAYARIYDYVKGVRRDAGRPVILVDSGDWTMGTLYDLTLGSQPLALYFMSLMQYDCITLGNHEFDYTPKGLAQIISTGQSYFAFHTPIVSSNINLGGNADLAPFVGVGKAIQPSYVQVLSNGLKVGYIGLMGTAAANDAPTSVPVSFAPLATQYSALQALVDDLRKAQGVNVVVALSHSGTDATGASGEDVDLARHVSGIDVIASGHTHTPLPSAVAVINSGWTTQIINAGAFGTNVARIDLTYHTATNSTTIDAATNQAMTSPPAEAGVTAFVGLVDLRLNAGLGAVFRQAFQDYDPSNLAKGIYHPVGITSRDLISNGANRVLSPNGLGNLTADAVRSVPNAIIAKTLAAAGGNPANVPGFDFTPFHAAIVPTGVLRGKLQAGAPLTFADVYNVLPLGISPDSSQSLPVGYPLVSAYLELADIKKLFALQLVAQANLAPSQNYLNVSGLRYGLKTAESYTFFKYATAAAVLQVTSSKAAAGSAAAQQAMSALSSLAKDSGAALLSASQSGNKYAAAMLQLNDLAAASAQVGANIGALGQVAAAAAFDSATGGFSLNALIVAKAIAAIDTVSAFAPNDPTCVGQTTDLSGATRVRVAADLYSVLLLGAVQLQFGTAINPYKSATSTSTLSAADLAGVLANRINTAPGGASIQELKEWAALLSFIGASLKGNITDDYASTTDFTQFPTFGAAVQARNASYPIASIGQLVSTVSSLQVAK